MIDTQKKEMVAEFYRQENPESFYLHLPEAKGYKLEMQFKLDITEKHARFVAILLAVKIITYETAANTGGENLLDDMFDLGGDGD